VIHAFKSRAAVAVLAASSVFAANAADVTGAGASFIYPVMSKWSSDYSTATGKKVNYQSIGSGGGIAQIKAATVDFGSSDAPLKPEELAAAGLAQFPSVIGGVVPVINVAGIAPGALKLDGPTLANIFLGKIKTWNDPAIAALNPGVKLPDGKITVVHRSDGSGTTFNFVNYLSKVNPEWKSKVGEGTSVQWPVGIGGKGNEGVAAYVKQIKGGIGYVEWAYAKKNKLSHTQLRNKEGVDLQPSDDVFKAAAANAEWTKAPGFGVVLTDGAGKQSWPITGVSYILMHKTQADANKGQEVVKFFDWSFKNGAPAAAELDYVPMPASVVKQVQDAWKANLKDASGKAIM